MRILPVLALIILALFQAPADAQSIREFRPLDNGEYYDQQFLADFWTALGYYPEGLQYTHESEAARLLITAGMYAEQGDTEDAINTFAILPGSIASAFPFLTTMNEDLNVPDILDPWYDIEDARMMMFSFYEEVWLPHPEYRDDYLTFKEDTMGRASRSDPTVPAVWILGHLTDYGFVADYQVSEDDPYLFLWNLLSGLTVYVQRANYYGIEWDRYSPDDYERAVVGHVGSIIHAAHDEAAREEMGRGFWSDLIDSYNPFETPTESEGSSGLVDSNQTTATSQSGTSGSTAETVPESDDERADYTDLFTSPDETDTGTTTELGPDITTDSGDVDESELEDLIDDLANRVEDTDTTEPADRLPDEELPDETTTSDFIDDVTDTEDTTVDDTVPDEFLTDSVPDRTPSETAPEGSPPSELGNYATVRLNEIADDLAVHIGTLANELGSETIDLVVLYNDSNVSEETLVNAEARYIAKREAFLAGLAIWDQFDMEIYTPLTLADLNDLIIADLHAPFNELKANDTQWAQYEAFENNFIEALAQIEVGIRNRRDEPDVQAAEAAALTAFLGDYNELLREIEDLLAGAITEAPEDTGEAE